MRNYSDTTARAHHDEDETQVKRAVFCCTKTWRSTLSVSRVLLVLWTSHVAQWKNVIRWLYQTQRNSTTKSIVEKESDPFKSMNIIIALKHHLK